MIQTIQDTLSRIRLKLVGQLSKLIEEHGDPIKLLSVDKSFGIVRAMDLLPSHLCDILGMVKVFLSYVICSNFRPVNVEYLAPNKATGPSHDDIVEELIACIPLEVGYYTEENAKVVWIIQDIVTGTSFEASIKAH